MVRRRPPKPGFQEASTPFAPQKLSLEQRLQLNAEVLAAYDYTCAVTQARFNAETARSANIVVVPIHPTEMGGKLERTNLLPLVPAFALMLARALTSEGSFSTIASEPSAGSRVKSPLAVFSIKCARMSAELIGWA